MVISKRTFGFRKEKEAYKFLKRQGLALIERNYQCRFGEINLIMMDHFIYVFIEVRYRTICGFGTAEDTITRSKQRKIINTALCYLQQHKLSDSIKCRFDVVTISSTNESHIQWIKDAFWM